MGCRSTAIAFVNELTVWFVTSHGAVVEGPTKDAQEVQRAGVLEALNTEAHRLMSVLGLVLVGGEEAIPEGES